MSPWNEEPLVFECAGDQLVGVLHRAARPDANVGVLVVVGGPQYRVGSHRQFVLMARDIAAAGYPVLRFDYRGMGDAEGDPRTFEDVDADIRAALAALRSAMPKVERIVLWGLCDAASAILMLDPVPPEVAGRVLVNPWARTEAGEARAYVRHYYLKRVLQRDFWRKLGSGGLDPWKAVSQFFQAVRRSRAMGQRDASSYVDRMLAGACGWHGPTQVILSGRDLTAREFAALSDGSSAWQRFLAGQGTRRHFIEDADHTFSERSMLDVSTQAVLEWLGSSAGARR